MTLAGEIAAAMAIAGDTVQSVVLRVTPASRRHEPQLSNWKARDITRPDFAGL
jgi:hypothetical protein